MWVEPTREALEGFEDADTEAEAFDALTCFADRMGAGLLSYHHITPLTDGAASGRIEFDLYSHGFPDDWVRLYETSDYRDIDPITAYAAGRMRPVLWSDVPHRVQLTEAQQDYMADLYRWLSPGDGLAVPLFGPSGCHGYGGIGWRRPIPTWDAVTRRAVQSVFESFHLRVCEMRLAALEKDFELDTRQLRILRGLARGQTDRMIAERLGFQDSEMTPAIGRILTSMGVSDRPSALLRARALGLI